MREALKAPSQKALVIMDNFSGQTTHSVLEKVEEEGIIVVMMVATSECKHKKIRQRLSARENPALVCSRSPKAAPGRC